MNLCSCYIFFSVPASPSLFCSIPLAQGSLMFFYYARKTTVKGPLSCYFSGTFIKRHLHRRNNIMSFSDNPYSPYFFFFSEVLTNLQYTLIASVLMQDRGTGSWLFDYLQYPQHLEQCW